MFPSKPDGTRKNAQAQATTYRKPRYCWRPVLSSGHSSLGFRVSCGSAGLIGFGLPPPVAQAPLTRDIASGRDTGLVTPASLPGMG